MPKAAIYREYGTSYDQIKIEEVEKPVALPNTIVIKVKVAAANPVDTSVFKGYLSFWNITFPYTVGYDIAGVVESVGDNVTDFAIGDNVFTVNWGHGSPIDEGIPVSGGAFAEYAVIKASLVAKIPDGITYKQAAALALVGLTAYQGLATLQVGAGTKVLIVGGSTAVGQFAIQLAKISGATVYTTSSSRSKDFVASFNSADQIINYNEVQWENYAELQGIDAIYDTVGQTGTFDKAKNVLKSGGRFITIASQEAGHDPSAHPPLAHASFFGLSGNGEQLSYLVNLVKEGKLKVVIDGEFPFTNQGVVDLLEKTAGGKSNGKNVLIIS
mmetsp:Transcript_12405/g.11239  ORF Transcript_12405/g.11239 Transcript_12405/m.11239 type:complete len:328 (+) Transcript_12405:75-1058(+)